jgi:type II secretory pathway component PulC
MTLPALNAALRWLRPRSAILSLLVATLTSATLPTAASEVPSLDKLSATRLRPLFVPARRPPEERVRPAATAQQQQQPDLVLNAVIIGPDMQTALLRRSSETKPFPVTIGTDVDGWSVSAISPNRVVLRNNAHAITLEFPARANVPFPIPIAPERRAQIIR